MSSSFVRNAAHVPLFLLFLLLVLQSKPQLSADRDDFESSSFILTLTTSFVFFVVRLREMLVEEQKGSKLEVAVNNKMDWLEGVLGLVGAISWGGKSNLSCDGRTRDSSVTDGFFEPNSLGSRRVPFPSSSRSPLLRLPLGLPPQTGHHLKSSSLQALDQVEGGTAG